MLPEVKGEDSQALDGGATWAFVRVACQDDMTARKSRSRKGSEVPGDEEDRRGWRMRMVCDCGGGTV